MIGSSRRLRIPTPALLLVFVATALGAARPARAQTPADTLLAEYKGGSVTPTEFSEIYKNLMPNERPPGDKLTARRAFLDRIVDRELLAREAAKTPLVLTPTEQGELERARRQMIQNDLFAQLTKDLPAPTDADLEAFRRQRTHLAEIRFVTFPQEQMARSWRMRLATGTPVSALDELMKKGGANAPSADSFRVVAADQIPDTLATVIWAMRPGQVSDVHVFGGEPVIIQLRGFTPRPGARIDNDMFTLKNEWQRRQYDRIRERIRADLVKRVDRKFVDEGMNVLLAGFLKLSPRSDVDSVSGLPIMRPNLPLPVFTAADTGLILARTKKGELNLVSYLRYWGRVPPFARPEVRERPVLEATVDRVLLEDELVAIGTARGLDKSPQIAAELERMRDGFALDHYFAANIEGKVSMVDDSLRAYFAARPGHYDEQPAIEARIILVDRKELADSLLTLIRGGQSFGDLAKTWSNEGQSAAKGGMTGFVVKGTNPNVGLENAMFATEIGKLGGPEQTPEGWTIWKVENKLPGKKRTFEDAREWVERDYRTIEGEKLLKTHLAELWKKANARVYPERVTLEMGRGGDWGD